MPILADTDRPLARRCATIARLWALQDPALRLTLRRDHGEPALRRRPPFLDGLGSL